MVSEQDKQGLTYADAGVDINAGNRAVDLIKKHIGRTHRSEVLSSLGGFSGFFALDLKRYQQPVLVSGTDGVGTKLKVAMLMDKHDTIGIDCVAMCANDILVNGAEPLFFLDYLAVGKLVPEKVEAIVKGVVEGCAQAGCALIGGETAEMPGLYDEDEYDLAGFVVGAVDKAKIIDGSQIVPGDVIVGITSSGIHSNGFSLARKVLLEKAGYGVDVYLPELSKTLGEELLTPTRIYAQTVKNLLSQVVVKGMVHITGGGLTENVPRVLPKGTKAVIDLSSWPVSPVFDLIYRLGNVPSEEMLRTFNLGIGYVFIVDKNDLNKLRNVLNGLGEKSYELGTIIKSEDTPSVQTLNQHFARG